MRVAGKDEGDGKGTDGGHENITFLIYFLKKLLGLGTWGRWTWGPLVFQFLA